MKCKLEYIEKNISNLEKIDVFNNLEEIRDRLDDIFSEKKKEYLKFLIVKEKELKVKILKIKKN